MIGVARINAALPARSSLRGMTVLEVVVSLAIAGSFLSLILPSTLQAYSRLKFADLRARAATLAASRAEEVSRATSTNIFPKEGHEGGLAWRIDLVGSDSGGKSSAAGGPSLRSYRISVSRDREGILVVLPIERVYTER